MADLTKAYSTLTPRDAVGGCPGCQLQKGERDDVIKEIISKHKRYATKGIVPFITLKEELLLYS